MELPRTKPGESMTTYNGILVPSSGHEPIFRGVPVEADRRPVVGQPLPLVLRCIPRIPHLKWKVKFAKKKTCKKLRKQIPIHPLCRTRSQRPRRTGLDSSGRTAPPWQDFRPPGWRSGSAPSFECPDWLSKRNGEDSAVAEVIYLSIYYLIDNVKVGRNHYHKLLSGHARQPSRPTAPLPSTHNHHPPSLKDVGQNSRWFCRDRLERRPARFLKCQERIPNCSLFFGARSFRTLWRKGRVDERDVINDVVK